MSKVFIIPDVHLKPWMFEKAKIILSNLEFDRIVFLGDLVDDWNQEKNTDLYKQTFEAAYDFIKLYPDMLYCFGNHDVSYLFHANESGYSTYAQDIVVEGMNNLIQLLPEENSAYIHKIDNVLFSHAGLTERFVKRCFGRCGSLGIDEIIDQINRMNKDNIWRNDSPIWARPQREYDSMRLYPFDAMQVVGHSPVKKPLREGKLLTLDTFSTYHTGEPIGDETFVWVDTEKEEYYTMNNNSK